MPEDANAAAARAYFEAWNRHDPEAIRSTFTDDGTFWDVNMKDPAPVDQVIGGFRQLLDAVADLRFDVVSVRTAGPDGAVAEWRLRGRSKAGEVDLPGIDAFDVAGGKLKAARAYMDIKAFTAQAR